MYRRALRFLAHTAKRHAPAPVGESGATPTNHNTLVKFMQLGAVLGGGAAGARALDRSTTGPTRRRDDAAENDDTATTKPVGGEIWFGALVGVFVFGAIFAVPGLAWAAMGTLIMDYSGVSSALCEAIRDLRHRNKPK